MNVAIIDYGSGNLRSATKAFEQAVSELGGGTIKLTKDPDGLKNFSHIVLPGVGAFSDCMTRLSAIDGLIESLQEQMFIKAKPFLGICVGMQLMADVGREHGKTDGFGWIPGEVISISPHNRNIKVPHMGWNDLQIIDTTHPLVQDLLEGVHTYFVHSYHFVTKDRSHVLATVNYGKPLTAIVGRDNLIGTQFHPEKSQQTGLRFIKNFLGWRP